MKITCFSSAVELNEYGYKAGYGGIRWEVAGYRVLVTIFDVIDEYFCRRCFRLVGVVIGMNSDTKSRVKIMVDQTDTVILSSIYFPV